MPASNEEIRQLQESLLKAVILGHALPGGAAGVTLPDLLFVTRGGTILLLDECLYGPISIGPSSKPLRIIGREGLQNQPAGELSTAYLRFQPTDIGQDTVKMTLEARMASGASSTELGLSRVHIEFKKTSSGWIAQEPFYSAN